MSEGTEPTQGTQTENLNRVQLLEKVRTLSERIETVTQAKKNAAKDYNDELKELRAEQHDTLQLLKEAGPPMDR